MNTPQLTSSGSDAAEGVMPLPVSAVSPLSLRRAGDDCSKWLGGLCPWMTRPGSSKLMLAFKSTRPNSSEDGLLPDFSPELTAVQQQEAVITALKRYNDVPELSRGFESRFGLPVNEVLRICHPPYMMRLGTRDPYVNRQFSLVSLIVETGCTMIEAEADLANREYLTDRALDLIDEMNRTEKAIKKQIKRKALPPLPQEQEQKMILLPRKDMVKLNRESERCEATAAFAVSPLSLRRAGDDCSKWLGGLCPWMTRPGSSKLMLAFKSTRPNSSEYGLLRDFSPELTAVQQQEAVITALKRYNDVPELSRGFESRFGLPVNEVLRICHPPYTMRLGTRDPYVNRQFSLVSLIVETGCTMIEAEADLANREYLTDRALDLIDEMNRTEKAIKKQIKRKALPPLPQEQEQKMILLPRKDMVKLNRESERREATAAFAVSPLSLRRAGDDCSKWLGGLCPWMTRPGSSKLMLAFKSTRPNSSEYGLLRDFSPELTAVQQQEAVITALKRYNDVPELSRGFESRFGLPVNEVLRICHPPYTMRLGTRDPYVNRQFSLVSLIVETGCTMIEAEADLANREYLTDRALDLIDEMNRTVPINHPNIYTPPTHEYIDAARTEAQNMRRRKYDNDEEVCCDAPIGEWIDRCIVTSQFLYLQNIVSDVMASVISDLGCKPVVTMASEMKSFVLRPKKSESKMPVASRPQHLLSILNSTRPTQFITIKELERGKVYPILSLTKIHRAFGDVLEAQISMVDEEGVEGFAQVALPKRYCEIFTPAHIQSYQARTIGMIYQGYVGRAYDLQFSELTPQPPPTIVDRPPQAEEDYTEQKLRDLT
ncbi:hypothetical protein GE061_008172 [Apolygus lucorum]|uniref:Uncharacterized protein n=1 Tax=Apolygus lucorum TaxID=248454 RepID=A0A8S9WQC4_APOLU|nr:hypothetical protein GE061_008172 [Apolygus lucorum]